MKVLLIWIIFFASHVIITTLGSSSVDCDFNNHDFYAVGYKYRCSVSNNLNISSPESSLINAVNGTHKNGKSNNDEIYFHAKEKHLEYFPRGLEKLFTNLTGIVISWSQLKEIHQEDLKPYTKLKNLHLVSNNIEVIEDGLFDFQPDIEVIIFEISKIFHISSTVFDNLSKLKTLYLYENKCTNKTSTNNRPGVLEVIKSVKSTCISPEYVKLDKTLKILENSYISSNTTFKENVEKFEAELATSKFSKFQSFKERVVKIPDWRLLDLSMKIEMMEKLANERSSKLKTDNSALKSELNHKIEAQNKQIISGLSKLEDENSALRVDQKNKINNEISQVNSMSNKTNERLLKLETDNSGLKAKLSHSINNQNGQIILMSNKINRIEQMLSDMINGQNSTTQIFSDKQRIQIPWMIIATAVVGLTQTIILAVILKQFLA